MIYHVNNLFNKFYYSVLATSTAANIQISQEPIDALLAAGVLHFNANEARDIDGIAMLVLCSALQGMLLVLHFMTCLHSGNENCIPRNKSTPVCNQLKYGHYTKIQTEI